MIYANENDPVAASWLENLPIRIDCVDQRSIVEVKGVDVEKFTQCHFFAGIAGWPLAFEMAGWPTDVPVWSGSCPCQPFSAAGKRKGTADERHLWPEFLRLIAECKPPTIFGEQVASKAGRDWLATVRTDLEALGYAVGAADLCAAGVGAPHIRQRLFWVADSTSNDEWRAWKSGQGDGPGQLPTRRHGTDSGLADFKYKRSPRSGSGDEYRSECGQSSNNSRENRQADSGMADSASERGRGWAADTRESAGRASVEVGGGMGDTGQQRARRDGTTRSEALRPQTTNELAGSSETIRLGDTTSERCGETRQSESYTRPTDVFTHSGWSDAEYIPCRDGKARPVKPGIRCLAHGVRGGMVIRRTRIENGVEIEEEKTYSRVAALKGFGNAIVPQVAATFIKAFMDTRNAGQ